MRFKEYWKKRGGKYSNKKDWKPGEKRNRFGDERDRQKSKSSTRNNVRKNEGWEGN